MIATTLFSTSHILMTVAAMVLVISVVWHLITKCQPKKRNLITRALLVAIVTTVGIGVYPILFKKKANQSDAQKGDIENTGGTIFICKITPMRDENGETVAISPSSTQRAIKTIENRLSALKLKGFKVDAQGPDNIRISLPGIFADTSQEIAKTLAQVAKLELKQVHSESGLLGDTLADQKFEISGIKNAAAARNLAAALLNPLAQPLVILERRTVSAELALQSAQLP